jgi:tetratricopeptide (TPR) repeat protein
VYKEGFIPAERELEVQEKTKRTIRVELTRGYASFTIDSEPSGADVYLDGEHLGKTPLLSSPVSVPYGFHLVELKMEGYKSFREYLKFDSPRVALDGSGKVTLHLDLFARAEQSYRRDRVQATMDTLEKIGPEHPDHLRALEFLGYIHLNDLKDYREAVGYYDQVLDIPGSGYREDRSVISYYNGGQAHYLLAESLFYTEPARSRVHYVTAAGIFQMVRERRSRIPVSQRGRVHQDSLFYLAVSWQKLYYLEKQEEYLRKARYAWRDYFDFFRPGYLRDPYFENQRSIAESYRAEVERLRSETR